VPIKHTEKKSLSGKAFKVWRISRRLTQNQAAEIFDMTQPGIASWERRGLNRLQHLALTAYELSEGEPELWAPTRTDRHLADLASFRRTANEEDTHPTTRR
jgi:hypothetical protein